MPTKSNTVRFGWLIDCNTGERLREATAGERRWCANGPILVDGRWCETRDDYNGSAQQ